MNMDYIEAGKVTLLIIVAFSVFAFLFYFALPIYDDHCLEGYAISYCNSINRTFRESSPFGFRCTGTDEEIRTGNPNQFYYISSEFENCRTKDALSYKIRGEK